MQNHRRTRTRRTASRLYACGMTDQIFACFSVAAWAANASTMWRPSSGGDPGPKRSARWCTHRLRNCPEFEYHQSGIPEFSVC
jgi:hypothetical protein